MSGCGELSSPYLSRWQSDQPRPSMRQLARLPARSFAHLHKCIIGNTKICGIAGHPERLTALRAIDLFLLGRPGDSCGAITTQRMTAWNPALKKQTIDRSRYAASISRSASWLEPGSRTPRCTHTTGLRDALWAEYRTKQIGQLGLIPGMARSVCKRLPERIRSPCSMALYKEKPGLRHQGRKPSRAVLTAKAKQLSLGARPCSL